MLDLIGHEDSSAAQAEDAKFEYSQGFIIDPTVDAEAGQLGKQRRTAEGQRCRGDPEIESIGNVERTRDLGQPGKWSIDGARGAKSRGNPEIHRWRCQRKEVRETRRLAAGTTGWCEIQGNLGDHQPEPDDPKCGATRRADRRRYRGTGDSGQPGESVNRHRRRMRDSRRLGDPSPAKPEMRDEGKPEACIEGAARGSEENGATRRITETSSAERCEIRGNSKIHRRHSQRTEEAGQLAEFGHPARPKERGVRGNPETRN